jgi:hypothetical protein
VTPIATRLLQHRIANRGGDFVEKNFAISKTGDRKIRVSSETGEVRELDVGFEVLTAVVIKSNMLWDIRP